MTTKLIQLMEQYGAIPTDWRHFLQDLEGYIVIEKLTEGETLRFGQYDGDDGFYAEMDSKTQSIILKVNGVEYRQTINEFIDNCKNKPVTNENPTIQKQ